MRMRPAIGAAATLSLVASVLAAPAVNAGSGTTRLVDDDGLAGAGGCGGSNPVAKTIQGAIDAAGSGDTIVVCPGTYEEQVAISGKVGLTLRASSPWVATILSPRVMDDPWLVGVVDSDDITVQGLRIVSRATQPSPTTSSDGVAQCDPVLAAVAVLASTAVTVQGNRIGVIGRHTLDACGYEVGVMVGSFPDVTFEGRPETPVFPKTRAVVRNNEITDFQSAGILAMGTNTRVDLTQNSIRYIHEDAIDCDTSITAAGIAGDRDDSLRRLLRGLMGPAGGVLPADSVCFAFGILDMFGTDGVIADNEIWSGVVARGEGDGAFLLGGIVELAQGPALQHLTPRFQLQTSSPVVSGNRIRGAMAGIVLLGGDGVRLVDNVSRYSYIGLLVNSTRNAVVRANRIKDAELGILATDEVFFIMGGRLSADNVFRTNALGAGMSVSCVDDTTGTGTDGTANTWIGNQSATAPSEPVGICPVP